MGEALTKWYKNTTRSLTTPSGVAVLFFFLAAILRLCLVTTAYYGAVGELYRDLEVIWRLYHFNNWPLLGPSSALGGFYFGALYYYLEAIFVRAENYAPFGADLLSIFFSLLSLPMLYKVCRRWFANPWVATLAVAIQSVVLFDIQNAYYISNPNLLSFFVLAFFYVLTLIIEGEETLLNYSLLGLTAGIAAQFHATALVLLPVILVWILWRFRVKLNIGRSISFMLFYILLYVPYLIYNVQHNFAIFRALFTIGQHQAVAGNRPGIILGLFNFFGSFFIFKDGFFNFYPGYKTWFFFAVALAAILIFLILMAWYRAGFLFSRAGISKAGFSILTAWLGFGTAMYIIFAVPPAYYYFIIMWPLPVIAAAWWLSSLWGRSKKYFWAISGSYLVLQILCVSVFLIAIYKPQNSFGNLELLFGDLKSITANQNYVVVNVALDLNQFYYYLRLSNIPQMRNEGGKLTVYEIMNCPGSGMSKPDYKVINDYKGLCLVSLPIKSK
jgi:4-amino-4-deoxy-L-arabinose transferase-like glycosyltransferase